MNNFVDKGIPTIVGIVPLITSIYYIVKWFIKSESRTLIDELLDLRVINLWDRFQSTIFLSSIMMMAIMLIIFLFDIHIISNIFFILFWLGLSIFCFLTLLYFWLKSIFRGVGNRYLTNIILTSYLVVLVIPYVYLDSVKQIIPNYINQNYLMTVAILMSLIFYNFIVLKMWLSILRYFKKPIKQQYKIEKITNDRIIEELERLYFMFMYDNERHILAKENDVKKIEKEFFVYHAKENVMIRYFKYPESQ
ncbi:hypothetical protein HF638_21190 [Paenibacillus sp. SZ31]|uniref:hypothetical protein n=1 Tax=Paenibacillus sp. SZ31 TaxID=2725555 RepID=UPI00146EB1E6|nr:hypothetical protein [Paenibacillus sp. SZ31]NMI06503.1 hypothetical protein [Paenibacillus sp. SZ31]